MPERGITSFWLWPNLLSLDAPAVALVWQDFLARCYHAPLPAPARCALGLTVWAIYLADRLLDVRFPPSPNEPCRHRFHRRHRGVAITLLFGVSATDACISLSELRRDLLVGGIFTAVIVAAYLAFFALFRAGTERWKQPLAAALFAAGVFLAAWTRTPAPWTTLAWPACLFAALCMADLFMIERWEGSPAKMPASVWIVPLGLVAGAFAGSRWFAAIALAVAGLLVVDLFRAKFSVEARRVLADVVLLTPLLFR